MLYPVQFIAWILGQKSSVLSLIDGTLVTAATPGTDSVETGTDGIASFTGLKAGYYIVKETKLPAGYVQTGTGSFYIKVENGKVKLVEKSSDGWVESSGNEKLVFTAASSGMFLTKILILIMLYIA